MMVTMFLISPEISYAASTKIYGGGKTTAPAPTLTSAPAPTHQAMPRQQVQSALPVYTTPHVKNTPATGPEVLPIAGLVGSFFAGLWLKRRA